MKLSIFSFARKAGRIMLTAVSILLVGIFILTGILWAMSPGKPEPFLDESGNPLAGSISEKTFVEINGVQQGMFIQSRDARNPVLLYLHGGMPDYFLKQKYPTRLEDVFTVVWWEQRGSGISYNDSISKESITMEQLISDTLAVTNYLRDRFHQDKIYLMGHSGGTFLGIYVIDKMPELYEAYIGMAQMSDQLFSEKIAYEYFLNHYKETKNQKMVDYFQSIDLNDQKKLPKEYLKIRDTAMHELGIGTMRNMRNIVIDLFLPSLYFSEYTLSDKYHLWAGKSKFSISQNWEKMTRTNLIETKNDFKIPVYFFHGLYDYTCSYELAKIYFDKINAPRKGFYTFDQSAHSPLFEEPEKMNGILINDVKNLRTDLADKQQN